MTDRLPPLEPRQQRFVDEYVIDFNGTQAAIRAGYSRKTASSIATENLRKPAIQAAIRDRMATISARCEVTAARVVRELAVVAFSDMRSFVEWGPGGVTLKAADGLSDEDARCVSEVSQTDSATGGSVKFKLHDKMKALTDLADRIGIDQTMMRRLYPDLDAEARKARVLTLLKGAKARAKAANE